MMLKELQLMFEPSNKNVNLYYYNKYSTIWFLIFVLELCINTRKEHQDENETYVMEAIAF